MKMKKNILLLVIFLVLVYGTIQGGHLFPQVGRDINSKPQGDDLLARLYEEGGTVGPAQVEGEGKVLAVLPDDDKGSRHQRFIVELDSGQTLLIAHNIDQAPRVENLQKGDIIKFSGEYEWNPEGGVIHWTHRDPSGRHLHGWIIHEGRKYW
jgi:hypothetical protein